MKYDMFPGKLILKILCFVVFLLNFSIATAQYYFDSTYIKKYYNNAVWSLYQNYSNHSLFFSQRYNKDSTFSTKLNPIAESLTDVGFSYSNEKLFLYFYLFSFPNQPSPRKSKPRAFNFVIGINDDNKVSELGLNWFTGYYEKNSVNFVPNFNDSTPYYNYDKLVTTKFFYNFINFTNKRKFSYGAVYRGTALQKKSASSFVYYASVNFNNINSDSAFIPSSLRSSYNDFGQMNRLSNAYLTLGIGYSATLVIQKVFFSNLTLMAGPGLQYQNYSFVDSKKAFGKINALMHGDIRFSIGLNFKNFYIISSSMISLNFYDMNKMSMTSSHLMNQLTLGLRLKRKGRIF